MTLIVSRATWGKKLALVLMSDFLNPLPCEFETNAHFTLFKINQIVVGINIWDYQSLFPVQEGYHTLSAPQKEYLMKNCHVPLASLASPFIVGKIIEVNSHPKSEKLKITKVALNISLEKTMQVVTNVSSIKVGQMIVVAQSGTILPSGEAIKVGEVMGVLSQGMFCSYQTLAINEDKQLISPSAAIGSHFEF